MWHFGRDAIEYSKRDFHIAVGKAEHVFERIYTKEFCERKITSIELQESPNKFATDTIQEKLNNSQT